ncbi:MAG TPA: hypothetical protein VIW92_00405, partial [Thermoanaerobaculia bacterium]
LAALLTVAGCQGKPQPVYPKTAPPAKTAPAASNPAPAAPKPSIPAPVRQAEQPIREDSAVVVDPGTEDDSQPATLAGAAKAERERRAHAGKPVAVITDKTLPQYARKGQITVLADPKEKEKKGATASAPPVEAPQETVRDEQYWRSRALEIRLRWRQAADDVKELEQRSTELRQRFYAETDSFVRDNQVKPEWDRVLDRLRQAKTDVSVAKQDLAQLHEDGRAAGALPGWLREGQDQEPEPEAEQEKLPPPQSIEPLVLNDNGGDGGRR